jgi:hypothetical protein
VAVPAGAGWPVAAGKVMPVPCSIWPTLGTVVGIAVGSGGGVGAEPAVPVAPSVVPAVLAGAGGVAAVPVVAAGVSLPAGAVPDASGAGGTIG